MVAAPSLDTLSVSIDRLITRCETAELKLHNLETAVLLIKATTSDEQTRAIAESALEILAGAK